MECEIFRIQLLLEVIIYHSFLYLHDCTFDIIFLSQNISVAFAQRLHTHLCKSRMRAPLGCRFIANQKREEHRISKPFEI